MNSDREQFKDRIDDYKDTIFAIIGFVNLYRFDDDTETMRDDVTVFQGRRLVPSNGKDPVTPDFGVMLPVRENSVLGEVKKSFPKDETLWAKDFTQLMSYDDDLSGWPSDSGRVHSHNIVLVLHHTRSARVNRYYQDRSGGEIIFTRPFIIVEFSRSDERKAYFFLRIVHGRLSEANVQSKLQDGIPIPLGPLLIEYSKVKLYDGDPPLPYLMELIWTNIVNVHASEDPKFRKLRRNQKLELKLTVDKIVNELHEGYSFRTLSGDDQSFESRIPKRIWVIDACKKFVESGDATWADQQNGKINFFFRKYDDVFEHFIDVCVGQLADQNQMKLFDEEV